MKLTWHIVWKDLTRMRLPMALWAAAFFWEFAIGVRLLRGSALDLGAFGRLLLYDYVAYGLQVAVSYFLVAALIHEDPLVGTTAFWPTRPISGARLLGAKLLGFAVIFGLFPAVVTLPWWLYCGYGVHEVFWAALDTFWVSILIPVLGLTIAALTGNMSRFLAGSFLTAAFLFISFTAAVNPDPIFAKVKEAALPGAAAESRIHLLLWLGLLGFPLVAAHQFLTRRLVRSLVMLGFLLGLLVYESSHPPLELSHYAHFIQNAALPGPALPTTDTISVELKDAYLLPGFPDQIEKKGPVPAVEELLVTNEPPGQYLSFNWTNSSTTEWSWPDGTRYIQNSWPRYVSNDGPPLPFPRKPPPREWWEWMNEHGRLHGYLSAKTYEDFVKSFDYRPSPRWEFYVEIPPEVLSRMRTSAPSCTIELKGDLVRWDPRPEFALAPGNGWEENGEGLRVARMTWDSREAGMDVVLGEHHPSIGSLIAPNPFFSPDLSRVSSTIINRKRGEMAQWVNGGNGESMRIGTVSISWGESWFAGPSKWSGADQWVREPTADWFSGASVVGSAGTVVAHFDKTVTIEKFVLRAEEAKPRAGEPAKN